MGPSLPYASHEEVIYKEEKSKLYYLKYYVDEAAGCTDGEEADAVTIAATDAFDPTVKHQILHRDADGRRYAVVATTRPETIMGDTAMCINPKDPKNTWLKGKSVIVPLVNRVIPVIEDRYVDIEFGTGCLKVTPAHDTNDYMLGKTHNLETIDIFNADATISEAAGMYVGMDRMEVRTLIAKDLAEAGLLEKVEDYDNKVGYSERNSDTAVEPRLCMQWFLRMQHFADIALPPVMNDELKFYPTKYKTTYNNWLANIQDWCISRQLWWGHRIPAYFLPVAEGAEEKFVVAETREEALKLAQAIPGYENITAEELSHDEDALDTWFSSWLWPISLFNGILDPGNKEISYYYPTNDLVTGPDIIFFWVARMIMAGYEYQGEMPFKNVYFTGIVRDKLGRKMSKSLGNSPDPLDLIARYGADGVRMGIMLSAPAGNDILFDESLCEQGRNFCNKIWNAFRLVKGWNVSNEIEQPESSKLAVEYFKETLAKSAALLEDQFGKYRLNEALMNVYSLFWDEFSAWYLEMVKPAYGSPIDAATYEATLGFFDSLLRLLHPFMPFITEELWQSIQDRKDGESLMVQSVKELATAHDEAFLNKIAIFKEVVGNIRAIRQQKNLSPREPLALQIIGESPVAGLDSIMTKMANLTAIDNVTTPDDTAVSFRVGTTEFAVPMGSLIDKDAEIAKMQEELAYHEKFLKSVEAKLNNPNFVSKAPEKIIAIERKKQSDATEKIAMLKESIKKLS